MMKLLPSHPKIKSLVRVLGRKNALKYSDKQKVRKGERKTEGKKERKQHKMKEERERGQNVEQENIRKKRAA